MASCQAMHKWLVLLAIAGCGDDIHPVDSGITDPSDVIGMLNDVRREIWAVDRGVALTLTGTVASATLNKLVVNVTTSQAWPSGLTLTKLNRAITLAVPDTALARDQAPAAARGREHFRVSPFKGKRAALRRATVPQ